MGKKKFTKDFKTTVVELYHAGTPVKKLASEYGLTTQTIYKWIKLYTPNSESGITEAEFLQLKKENARLKEDNDILKKVLTIFAKK